MCKRLILSLTLLLGMAIPLLANKPYVLLTPNKTFVSQCTSENTIYEIRNDFNLNGDVIRIPKGSVLKLNGGSINNGKLYLLSDTKIIGTGEVLNRLLIGVEHKNVEDVLIEGVELQGYSNAAKKKEEIVVGIKVSPGGSVNGFTVTNCSIHDFNAGISLRGSNVTIKDNVFYDNGNRGTDAGVHDDEVDVCAGYSPNNPETCNFIITGNRCLSKYVHRNIDCGKLLSEDNILITNNLCVSMDGTTQETTNTRKAQCILVGYTGVSNNNKNVIITNNICKNCSWAGIYVRANNTEKTAGENGYVAMITGNYIENVVKSSTSKFGAGIACELRDGSIISNNVIKKCTQGVNIGQVFSNGHVKVFGNVIDDCNYGILNDAVAKKVDITENSITNVGVQGISITEVTSASGNSAEKFVSITGNTITFRGNQEKRLSKDSYVGVFLFNVGTIAYRVSSNFIHGDSSKTLLGIQFRCNSNTSLIDIKDNYVSNCHIGVSRIAGNDVEGRHYNVKDNILVNCTVETSGL